MVERSPNRPRRPGPNQNSVDEYDEIFYEDAPSSGYFHGFSIRSIRRWGTIAAAAIVAIILVLTFMHRFDPGAGGKEVIVEVPKGATVSSISTLLDQKGVVPSALAFRVWAKIDGSNGLEFQAGEYTFHANESDGAALAVLRHGPKQSVDKITIPEGFRLAQIAQRVGSIPGMSAQKFMDLATDGKTRSDLEPKSTNSLEGLLFPSTYTLSPSDNEQTLLQRMINEMEDEVNAIGINSSQSAIGHTPYETLVIASLIEAEAKFPDERGKMSQVIENRLFKAMPLQIDASVMYGTGKRTISSSDLKAANVYNTYLNHGLPPTPIDSPGLPSIRAALAPTPGPWYYWVVTGTDQSSSFATTLDEFNQDVALAKQRGVIK